jgi:hypothetical protein
MGLGHSQKEDNHMIIEINYDLNKPGQNYDGLINKIKSLGSWANPCKSCWLVSTSLSAKAVADVLKGYIDPGDNLLVNQFTTHDYGGWLDKQVWDWIRQHSNQYQELR